MSFKPYFPEYLGFDLEDDNVNDVNEFIREAQSEGTLRKSDKVISRFKAFAKDAKRTILQEGLALRVP